jgi:D-beta-D-heptose 7-phosphate kinase/D-beta-D-heptose 1-phosphate adenosyltransferase
MNILVIGEIILDVYLQCESNKIATEGLFPTYNVVNITNKLGGAANVAVNMSNLNHNTTFVSILGEDENKEKIIHLLNEKCVKYKFIYDKTVTNTIKTRIVNNQIFYGRFDIENKQNISVEQEDEIMKIIMNHYHEHKINGIVLSDYNKGLLTDVLIHKIVSFSNENEIVTFIDPKSKGYSKYKNCTFFKPNKIDASLITNMTNIDDILSDLYTKINCKYLVYTLASDGIILYDGSKKIVKTHIKKFNCIDPTGAGDVVISVLAYYYLKTSDLDTSIELCNFIAGKSVEYVGNYICSERDINDFFNYKQGKENNNLNNKLLKTEDILYFKELNKNKKIVFTNGCFDIIHTAHLKLLKFCKTKGDIVVVGLNTDSSIKKLKGNKRPINKNQDRFEFLALLDFIDFIIFFDEDTPYNILSILKPYMLVKGGDYKLDQLLGNEFCENIEFFNYIEKKSTSLIIKEITNV